jgi:hypothetical protein
MGPEGEVVTEEVGETSEALTCAPPNYPVSATSSINWLQPASNAIDGNSATRWESAHADSQQLEIQLSNQTNIAGVRLNWETACGKDYDIDVKLGSNQAWTPYLQIRGNTTTGVVEHLKSQTKVWALRMNGLKRCTNWGFSLYEFGVVMSSKKCYLDGDGDAHGKPNTATESCNACPAGRVENNNWDCYDSNARVNRDATTYYRNHRGDGSWDYNCNGTMEPRSESGNVSFVCTNSAGQKTSDCSQCVYNFVAIDATDCGKFRCSLGASEYIHCR